MKKNAALLARYRVLFGSQGKIAGKLGVSDKWISNLATGKADAPLWMELLIDMAERLPPKDWPEKWR